MLNDPEVRCVRAAAQTKVTWTAFDADSQRQGASWNGSGNSPTIRRPVRRIVRGKPLFLHSVTKNAKNQPIISVRRRERPGRGTRDVLDPNRFSQDGTVALDWMFPLARRLAPRLWVEPEQVRDEYPQDPQPRDRRAPGRHKSAMKPGHPPWHGSPLGQAFWYVRDQEEDSPGRRMETSSVQRS